MQANIQELPQVIKKLHAMLENTNTVVLLQGDLASGKTTLVKEYVKFIGLDDCVTSPTFSLQTQYGNHIYHYDLYNKTLEEFISLGLLEEFEKEGIHFVEWGEDDLKSILQTYGFEVITIKIKKMINSREYEIEA